MVGAGGASRAARKKAGDASPSISSGSPKLQKLKSTRTLEKIPINYLPFQGHVRDFYGHNTIQVGVAALIVMNFIVSATKAQCCLEDEGKDVFKVLEYIFNIAFTIELLVNMYGYFWCPFWSSAWNVFDFVIVVISDVSMFVDNVPGMSSLRLLRAFRVVRLFKRVPALKMIIEGVLASLPGVLSAFAVLFLITCIWAIMATDFFRESRPDQFGNFFLSVLTFFQVMTYDSWYSGVAGTLIQENGFICAVFFIIYVFANSIIMMNVVTAILLERFIAAVNEAEEKAAAEKAENQQSRPTVSEDSHEDDLLSSRSGHSLEVVNDNTTPRSGCSVEEVTWKSEMPTTPPVPRLTTAPLRQKAMKKMKEQIGQALSDLDRNMMLAVSRLKSLNLTEASPTAVKTDPMPERIPKELDGSRPASASGASCRQLTNHVSQELGFEKVRRLPDPCNDPVAAQTVTISVRPRGSADTDRSADKSMARSPANSTRELSGGTDSELDPHPPPMPPSFIPEPPPPDSMIRPHDLSEENGT